MQRLPSRRRRPALSCIECRRRKIKCDRNEPCTHCAAAKTQCIFYINGDEHVPIRPQSQLPSSWGSTPTPLASICNTTTTPALVTPKHIDAPPTIGHNDVGQTSQAQGAEIPDLHDLLRRVQILEQSTAAGVGPGMSEAKPEDSKVLLNKTRMLGSSHQMGWGGEFTRIWACYTEATGNGDGLSFQGPETQVLIVQIGDLLRKCKIIARNLKIGRPSRCLSCPEVKLAYPLREIADKLANLYFGAFESTHRILHVPTFWAEYQRFWNDPETIPMGLRLKVLLVIGIGSSLSDHTDSDTSLRNTVHQWIYAAQNWLSGPLEKDRLNITGIQVHCLTVLARQIFSIGGDLVWMSMGSLIHRAMQIGLHRDPKHLPTMSVMQAEARRRLWATILELVAQSSLDSAMPSRISFDEFDTQYPANINDNEIDESTTLLNSHPRSKYTSTSIQLLLLDSLPLRLRVLQLLNGLHSNLSYLDTLSLSAEITDAYRACNKFIRDHQQDSAITPFHRNFLFYLIRRFLIPLHSPFANQARTNPLFHYSLKISLDTSMTIVFHEPSVEFSRLMALGGGLIREGIRYAMSVISVELLTQVETQHMDGGSLQQNSEYLKQAVRNLIELSAERIRQGETNIKSHMFLSMVLGQVEAMEGGKEIEGKIAESARDSLGFCCGLLEGRVRDGMEGTDGDFEFANSYSEEEGYGMGFDLEFFLPDAGFS